MRRFLFLRFPLILFLVVYGVVSIFLYRDFSITADERDVYLRGKLMYTKIRGNDAVLQKDFVIPNSMNEGLLFYNHFHHAILYALNGSESYEIYHLLNLLFGATAFIAVYEMVLKATKSVYIATIGILFLFITPRFTADIPANPKDTVCAIYYIISLSLIILSSKWNSKLRILILGLSFGLTGGARMIGYSIHLVNFLWSVFQQTQKNRKNFLSLLVNQGLESSIILFLSLFVHTATHPFIGADPFNNLKIYATYVRRFPWVGSELFFSQLIPSVKLPLWFVPGWLFVSTPVMILALCIAGIYAVFKKNVLAQFSFFALVLNLFIVIVTQPVLYNGIRHVNFLYPLVTLLAVSGFYWLWKEMKKLRFILIFLVCLQLLFVIRSYVILHPYEYVYFNEVVGGLRGAKNMFELDYWSTANRESFKALISQVGKKEITNKTIGVCNNSTSVEEYAKEEGVLIYIAGYNRIHADSDYIICGQSSIEGKEIQGKIIYTVFRDSVPLSYVFLNTKNEQK